MMDDKRMTVNKCVACGGTHYNLLFHPARPQVSHYALCPTTNTVILSTPSESRQGTCCYIDAQGNPCERGAVYAAIFGHTLDSYTLGCEQHVYVLVPAVEKPEEVWIVLVDSEWPWSNARPVPIEIDERTP